MHDGPQPKTLVDELKCEDRKKERRYVEDTLKVNINKLLYENLPPECPIGRMEDIGCELFNTIMAEWDKHNGGCC